MDLDWKKFFTFSPKQKNPALAGLKNGIINRLSNLLFYNEIKNLLKKILNLL